MLFTINQLRCLVWDRDSSCIATINRLFLWFVLIILRIVPLGIDVWPLRDLSAVRISNILTGDIGYQELPRIWFIKPNVFQIYFISMKRLKYTGMYSKWIGEYFKFPLIQKVNGILVVFFFFKITNSETIWFIYIVSYFLFTNLWNLDCLENNTSWVPFE